MPSIDQMTVYEVMANSTKAPKYMDPNRLDPAVSSLGYRIKDYFIKAQDLFESAGKKIKEAYKSGLDYLTGKKEEKDLMLAYARG